MTGRSRDRHFRIKQKMREKYRGDRCPERYKIKYKSRKQADEQAEIISRKLSELVTSYLCKHCGFWHVGHDPDDLKHVFQVDLK